MEDVFLATGWTTHLKKNMRKSNFIISPGIGVKIQKMFETTTGPIFSC